MCSAIANPEDVTFAWKIVEDNYTEDATATFETGLNSYLVLDRSFHMLRTYICYTNNSVGESTPCEIEVPGESRYFYFDLDHRHVTNNHFQFALRYAVRLKYIHFDL